MDNLKATLKENISAYQSYFVKASRSMRMERVFDLFKDPAA